MKIRFPSVISALVLLSLESCMPELPPLPSRAPESVPPQSAAIVWKTEYKSSYSNNYIYKNLLIQGISPIYYQYKVVALTLDSGKLVWETENLSQDVYFDPSSSEESYLANNKLILSHGKKTVAIDVETGQILWQDLLDKGDYNTCIIDDFVYKTTQSQEKSELYRYDINTGQKELLFTLTKAEHGGGKYEPTLRMPVKWTDHQGNELLILINRGYSGTSEYRVDMMAWNLTADSMAWYRKELDQKICSNRPLIDDNRVYVISLPSVSCFDAANGKLIWRFYRDPADNLIGFRSTDLLLVKDKLIAKSDGYWMYGLDKLTGKRLWANSNTATKPYLMREHQDTLWFSSGAIYAIDANTGRTLIDAWDNNSNGPIWNSPVVHHPTLGYIYTIDGDYIYCLDPSKMK